MSFSSSYLTQLIPTGDRPAVAIVGGGASGVLTAVHLLRQKAPVRIVLIEDRARLGRGVAYGTTCDAHLLNVPACGMSAYPDEPEDFLNWARTRRPGVDGGSFLPRRLYGDYLESCLDREIAAAPRHAFTAVQGRVTGVVSGVGGAGLRLADGGTVWASQVVLALGNSAGAAALPRWEAAGPVRDAWQPDALAGLAGSDRPVVLVGTGLTAVDVMISLEQAVFAGPIHAVSRRGLLPRAHVSGGTPPAAPPAWAPATARELVAALRAEVRRAAGTGRDWRNVVDSLRPVTQELWAGLPEGERTRLHRHALRYWEVHRHRMAPQIAGRIAALQTSGQLHVTAGRILSIAEYRAGADVVIRPRHGGEAVTIAAGAVIRCIGPKERLAEVGDPVLDGLFATGDARPGPLGLGLAIDPDGRLLDCHGAPSQSLWAVGPLRRGALLETTAIPEIRVQAAALARTLPGAVAAAEAAAEAVYELQEAR